MCNPVNAYQEAVKKFTGLDPEDMAARSGAIYNRHSGLFEINYFGSPYMVNTGGKVWRAERPEEDVPFNDRTLIVQYLSEAAGLPPRGRWLSFLELPDGAHHYAPLQTDAMLPLAEVFGKRPESFSEAALFYGGRPLDMGDYSFFMPVFPRLPLALILWEEDEEFSAKSNILFDSVSPAHLTTAALWVLGVELARKMIGYHSYEMGKERAITWLEGKK